MAWVASLIGVPAGVVAIDGKTVRRSGGKAGKGAIHMVSAFVASQCLVLGQVNVAEKSNEIVAIPKLLDMLVVEGAIITIDAMSCQRVNRRPKFARRNTAKLLLVMLMRFACAFGRRNN